jgi:hydrogenase maturation protease
LIAGRAAMLHVVCFGNPWQGDDGFGIHVFRRLCGLRDLPRWVKLFDAGIAGLGSLGYFENCTKVVIVDAMKAGGRAGRVRRLHLDDLNPPGPELSLHAFGVEHLLAAFPVALGGWGVPEVVLIGAEIGEVRRFSDELTPPLQAALDRAVRLVRREIIRHAQG